MNVPEFSVADLVAMENDLEGLPPSLERDAKSNLLKYLLISKVKEYELHYDDLFYNLQLEGSLGGLATKIISMKPNGHLSQPRTALSAEGYVEHATRVQPALERLVERLAEAVGGSEIKKTSVKSPEGVQRKADKFCDGDVRRITDMARVSVVCDSPAALVAVFEGLQEEEFEILKVRNGFASNYMPSGYRDVNVNIVVDEHLCEIQLHLRPFYALKPAQHQVYEWARELKVTLEMTVADLQQETTTSETTEEMIRLAEGDWCHTRIVVPYVLFVAGRYDAAQPGVSQWLVDAQDRVSESKEGTTAWRQANAEASTHRINLACIYKAQGNFSEAERLCADALEQSERVFGTHHPDTVRSLNNCASLAKAQGNLGQAELWYRKALKSAEKMLSAHHPLVAGILNNLAGVLQEQGKFAEAERQYGRVVEGWEESTLGGNNLQVATGLNNQAGLLIQKAQYDLALSLLGRSLHIREEQLRLNHPVVLNTLGNMATALHEKGDFAEAETIYRRIVAAVEHDSSSDYQEKAGWFYHNLARVLDQQGNCNEAEFMFRRSLAIKQEQLGADHAEVGATLNGLAEVLQKLGEHEEAATLSAEALVIRENTIGPDHFSTAESLNNSARRLENEGRFDEAWPLYERSHEIRLRVFGPSHPEVANSLSNKAGWLEKQGQHAPAEPLYRQALDSLRFSVGEEHHLYAKVLNNLAMCLKDQGKLEDAEATFVRAVEIGGRVQGDPREQANTVSNLAIFRQRMRAHGGLDFSSLLNSDTGGQGSSPSAYGGLDFSSLLNSDTGGPSSSPSGANG